MTSMLWRDRLTLVGGVINRRKNRNANAKRTLQNNKFAANVCRDYLIEKGIDSNFEDFDEGILDETKVFT